MKDSPAQIVNASQFRREVDGANRRFSQLLTRIQCVSPDIIDRYKTTVAPLQSITDALEASDRAIRLADFLLHEP